MQDVTNTEINGEVAKNGNIKDNKNNNNKIYLSTSQIMTKILLGKILILNKENNRCIRKNEDNTYKNTNEANTNKYISRHRLLIFSDLPSNEKYLIDQKLLFLFKKQVSFQI